MLLQRLGYWGEVGSGLPVPSSFVDESWDGQERAFVDEHLRRGFVARAYLGTAACRICGIELGSQELTDGVYLWPEGLRHYVTAHSVRLPAAFIRHVHAFTDEIESADVDETWWRSIAD